MELSPPWLPNATGTVWDPLGQAMHAGVPVPAGFIANRSISEEQIRSAYEEIKVRERTHFVAVRGPSHAMLNVIGADALVHTLRRLWTESPDAAVLVQRMIHAEWCGKAHWHRKNLRIKANEGMMVLDPDTYLVSGETGKCIRRSLEAKQRKMIRRVDGVAKVIERDGTRTPMPAEHLTKIVELAARVRTDIGWAIDDAEKVWLISVD
jgi:hypothetical protein